MSAAATLLPPSEIAAILVTAMTDPDVAVEVMAALPMHTRERIVAAHATLLAGRLPSSRRLSSAAGTTDPDWEGVQATAEQTSSADRFSAAQESVSASLMLRYALEYFPVAVAVQMSECQDLTSRAPLGKS